MMEITFEEVASNLEPLSQVFDAAFQEAQDASSFGQLLHVAHLTEQEDPFDEHPFFVEPTCLTTSLKAVMMAIANDVQPPSTAGSADYAPSAAVVVPVVASAVQRLPPPSATTQTQLPFKKRKSPLGNGSGGDSSKKKKNPPSPTTPSTSTKGNPVASLEPPSTTTPRGVEAALIIDTISKRIQDRPVRDGRTKSISEGGGDANEKKEKIKEEIEEEADENRHPEANKAAPEYPRQCSSTKGKRATVGGGGRGGGGASRQLSYRKSNAAAATVAAVVLKPPRRAAPPQSRPLCNRDNNRFVADASEENDTETDDDDAEGAAAAAADSRRAKRATSEELAEMKLTDPSKYKRIMGNRKSAANSKARKDATLRETKAECERLLKENRMLAAALEKFQKRVANGGGGDGGSGSGGGGGGGAVSKSTKSAKLQVRLGVRAR